MQSTWWFVGAMLLGILEVVTLDLTLAMLAGGALAAGFAALLGLSLPWTIVVFLVTSTLLIFTLRPWLLRSLRERVKLVETNVHRLIGKEGVAIDGVTDRAGRVKLLGEVWTARLADDAGDVVEGQTVVVIDIKGATAIVAPQVSA